MAKTKKSRNDNDEESGRKKKKKNTTTTTTTTSSSTSRGRSISFSMTSTQQCYVGQILCAVVLLLALHLNNRGAANYEYGMAVACVGMILAFVGLVLFSSVRDDVYNKQIGNRGCTCGYLLDSFLLIWWFIGATILTFRGPYTVASNGYFAVWGGFIFAVGGFGDGVTSRSQYSGVVGLKFCAIILLIALPRHINGNRTSSEAIYALIVAILTMITIIVMMWVKQPPANVYFIILFIFAILWIVLPFLTTFRSPFTSVGNGYFASWIGAIAAFVAASNAVNAID